MIKISTNAKLYIPVILLFGIYAMGLTKAQAADNTLKKSISVQSNTNKAAAKSQKRINRIADESDRLLDEYRYTLRKTESLKVYNDHIEKIVNAQNVETSSISEQIRRIDDTNREIIPLMLKMLDALNKFVELDIPFLQQERQQRLDTLASMMERADITTSDKFRRIMEAYQIETEYGRTIEAYKAQLRNGSAEQTVEFLRVGRLALFYQTLDARESGMWNQTSRNWEKLPDKYRSSIRQGVRIARKQSAPDLLTLPINAPEVIQ